MSWLENINKEIIVYPDGIQQYLRNNMKEGVDPGVPVVPCPKCGEDSDLIFDEKKPPQILCTKNCGDIYHDEIIWLWSKYDKTLKTIIDTHVFDNLSIIGAENIALNQKTLSIDPEANVEAYTKYCKQYRFSKKWTLCNCHFAWLTYNPNSTIKYSEGNKKYINTYHPPKWKEDYHKKGTPIQSEDEIPEIIHDFIMHIVGSKQASYEYVLDWLANGLKTRNQTILCIIDSVEGLGKGTLHALMSKVHGEENSAIPSDDALKKSFNKVLMHKTWLCFNEVNVKKESDMNRLKAMIDETLEIEIKGKDKVFIPNHGNYLIFSNDSDAINVTEHSRRFSIPDSGDTPLSKAAWIRKYQPDGDMNCFVKKCLLDDTVVDRFARFLWNREIKHNMYAPFQNSDKFRIACESTLKEWQEYLVFDYAKKKAGTVVECTTIKEAINLHCGISPGFRKQKELCKLYPEIMEFFDDRQGERRIKFKSLNSQIKN
jgi:hypothetical protein